MRCIFNATIIIVFPKRERVIGSVFCNYQKRVRNFYYNLENGFGRSLDSLGGSHYDRKMILFVFVISI